MISVAGSAEDLIKGTFFPRINKTNLGKEYVMPFGSLVLIPELNSGITLLTFIYNMRPRKIPHCSLVSFG